MVDYQTLRAQVIQRDRGICRYCGLPADRAERYIRSSDRYVRGPQVDHVIPRKRGGISVPENLVLACHWCNQRKGGHTPNEVGMSVLPVAL